MYVVSYYFRKVGCIIIRGKGEGDRRRSLKSKGTRERETRGVIC